ncbi:MAG TPA: SDR family NAD(P)-dependent oxidoreductase [Polyangiaceae bacterium]|jgi:NAD(P)-dependent dehydrogenase (short-subunit alcohol dehydrogenase family)|nr:SDR family NAD(P)-dependent oxidoreductase [Polyangiaceae bacterium]
MGHLDGKAALVMGGGRGIGRAVALLFAREGASVLVNDSGTDVHGKGVDPSVARAVADEIRSAGGTAVPNHDDCASSEGAERVVTSTIDTFGRVDTVVYAAGILGDQALARADDRTVRRVMDTHLTGAFHTTRIAAVAMQGQRGGRIVLTTSAAGLLGNFGQVAYSAAAAATYGLMRAASIELQRHGVFVNAVAPMAKTRLTEELPVFAHVDTMTPEHVAPAYLFFGSELGGDQTGNVLAVAGGRISLYKVVESAGRFKESDGGVWSAEEIRDQWNAMAKP